MRTSRLVLVASLLAAAAATAQQRGDPPRRTFLFKDARGEIAAARARGDTAVTLVVASMPGSNAKAVELVRQLGGTIRFRDDDVDYLRVRLPVDAVDKLVGHALIHSADVSISRTSRAFGLANGEPSGELRPFDSRDTTRRPWPPTLPETPLTDRYDPVTDMNGIAWRAANPTFDGRGTGIAIIDQQLDAFLPELQVARNIDGTPTRKIVGYMNAVDLDDEDDGQWLRMKDSVVASGDGRFTYKDSAYTAPAAGTWRVALLDEAVFDSLNRSGLEKDLNRDGNPKGSSRLFGVLWNEATNDVYLDTDQDRDFRDEKAYTDYAVRPEFGTLGTDKPATPVRESVSFAVQTDRARKLVSFNFGVASHASLVVGAAVGSRGNAGRFDGVAPGAKLVNMIEGGAAYGQTEAVIRAVKHPEVDVVFLEQSSVIARNYLLFDGRLVPTVVYGRLIATYGKPIVIPTHNYAVLAAIDDYALAPGAISVGGHESKANFLMNHGVRVQHDDNLLITGGYGPMGNGALKPDIIAPSNYVSTGRGFMEGTAIPGLMQLPPGYNIAGGTSTATPTTAGAVALLISAAKQSNVKWDAFRIRQALMTSGRWVPHLPANKQGNGVVNIAGAWDALKAMDTVKTGITITSRAPVKHSVSHLLADPDVGVGIFERDGWSAGMKGERVVTLTRTTGPRGSLPFMVGWIGNSGTFTAPASVDLPLNQPVNVIVGIAPTTAGVHTAILTFDYAGQPGVEYRTQATVVAAAELTAANGYKVEDKVDVPRPAMTHLYYRVPAGVSALRLDVAAPKRRRVSISIMRPDTRNVTGIGQGGPNAGPLPPNVTYSVLDPAPGVWEVRLQDVEDTRSFDWQQAKKDEPVPSTSVTVTFTALGAEARTATPSPSGTGATGIEATLANRFGAFPGAAIGMPLGAIRRDEGTLGVRLQRIYDIDVPPGTTTLTARARVENASNADLDLYVFDCTAKECNPARADGDAQGPETVVINNPAAGKWKVVLDHSGTPSDSARFAYEDIVFNPAFGFVAATDQPADRAVGGTWTLRANAWASGTMPNGREPHAAVLIQARPKGTDPFTIGIVELRQGATRASESGTRNPR